MAMSLEEVSAKFTEIGWNHKVEEDNNLIVSIGGNEENNLMFFTSLPENGEIFDMAARLVDAEGGQIKAKDNQYVNVLMSYLLLRNYETKFGTWEFDINDGTISFAVEIPLEDNTLTNKQLTRITGLMNSAGKEAGVIKHILETGEIEKEDSEAEMIAKLEAMLLMLKSQGSDSSEDGI